MAVSLPNRRPARRRSARWRPTRRRRTTRRPRSRQTTWRRPARRPTRGRPLSFVRSFAERREATPAVFCSQDLSDVRDLFYFRLEGRNTTTDQFHPTLSVTIERSRRRQDHRELYDRRDDPNNCLANVYSTQSADSGATWSANVKMTAAQSDFDGTRTARLSQFNLTPSSATARASPNSPRRCRSSPSSRRLA